MSLIYKKGSLFEAPKGSILVHSCNAKGVWGAGIAKEMAKRFPNSYEDYKQALLSCDYGEIPRIGKGFIFATENGYNIACLVTSKGYGKFKDDPNRILVNTHLALWSFFQHYNREGKDINQEIHSNKFNSGLFGVPWKDTEKVLLDVMKEIGYTKDWTVWEL